MGEDIKNDNVHFFICYIDTKYAHYLKNDQLS